MAHLFVCLFFFGGGGGGGEYKNYQYEYWDIRMITTYYSTWVPSSVYLDFSEEQLYVGLSSPNVLELYNIVLVCLQYHSTNT